MRRNFSDVQMAAFPLLETLELWGMLSIELLTFWTSKLWTILYEMSQRLDKTWPQ
jgi:hypothetical protein